MAIGFRAGAEAANGGNTSSQAITIPATVEEGDYVVLVGGGLLAGATLDTVNATSTGTAPVPLTDTVFDTGAQQGNARLFGFTASATDAGKVITVSLASGAEYYVGAALAAYSGCAGPDGEAVFAVGTSLPTTNPTVTTALDGDWVVCGTVTSASAATTFSESPVTMREIASTLRAAIGDSNGPVNGTVGAGGYDWTTAGGTTAMQFTVALAPSPVAGVPRQTSADSTGGGTLTLPLSATIPGNTLVVAVSAVGSVDNPTSVTVTVNDEAENFIQRSTFGGSADQAHLEMWEDRNIAGGQTEVEISVSGGSGTIQLAACAYEIPGLAPAGAFDKAASAQDLSTGATFSSGSTATLSQASEIAIGFLGGAGATGIVVTGPSSPWVNTEQQGSSSAATMFGYNVLSATTPVSYAGSFSPNSAYAAMIVTFKVTALNHAGAFAIAVPKPASSLAGKVGHQGALAIPIPRPVVALSATVLASHTGNFQITIPDLRMSLVASVTGVGAPVIAQAQLPTAVAAIINRRTGQVQVEVYPYTEPRPTTSVVIEHGAPSPPSDGGEDKALAPKSSARSVVVTHPANSSPDEIALPETSTLVVVSHPVPGLRVVEKRRIR